MLTKNDLVLILTDMQESGNKEAEKYLSKVFSKPEISLDILKFINDNRPFEVAKFYERMRKNHNDKKSNLYKNIVKETEDPEEAISTLSAFALNLFLYSKHVAQEEKTLFFKHVRAEEVTRILNKYYKEYDVTSVMKELRLIKADILAFEYLSGRRDETGHRNNIISSR